MYEHPFFGVSLRAVALTPMPDNLLDHLGVLAAILDIPLIVSEQQTYDLAISLYPQVKTTLMDGSDITPAFLAANFDVLFVSSKRWAIEMYPLFPLLHNKQMRIVYCPHGNSDKGHSLTKELAAPEDVSLVYGNHMIDLLKDTGMLDQIQQTIVTGNYRRLFFQEHKAFYLRLAEKEVFAKLDRKKKTIFYSPTWSSQENPSSFFDECEALIKQITPGFNLLIKLHPFLFEKHPAQTVAIFERYKEHPQVLFLENFPPIYPLLELADVYLGDFSSIGYDFLSFDKPMYFFNSGTDRGSFLHRTGMSISAKKGENVFELIEKSLEKNKRDFSGVRKEIYEYAFGKEKSLRNLRRELFLALKDKAPI